MGLRTRFVGIDVSSPVFVASAGITEKVELLKRCQDNGAGGAVMKSLFQKELSRQSPTPRFHVIRHPMGERDTFTLYSYEQASEWDVDRYAEEVHRATEELDLLVIPSINCFSLDGWAEYARKMEEAGARAIELNTSCPHGSITFSGQEVEQTILDSVRAAREVTTVPLIAKLSPMVTNPGYIAKELEGIGVQAVTIFNRMTALEIDVETELPIMHQGYAGHGGPWAMHYPLRWISQLSPQLSIDIAGTSGVSSGEDVAKYLLCGATVVQVCTAVVMQGYSVLRRIRDELEAWMGRRGYEGVDEFRGSVCRKILGTEEIPREKIARAAVEERPAPPCQEACPIGTSAQGYINLIAEGRYAEAYALAAERNPFSAVCGRVCHHPCEPACTRTDVDDPLAIAELKRFAADRAARADRQPVPPPITRSEKVAIVGGGPAGLTAAMDLRLQGYPVTIIDSAPVLGGMMVIGIPRFRLPTDVIQQEIGAIVGLGIDVRTRQKLGRDFTVEDLRDEGFDAVLIAVGAHRPLPLDVPGEGLDHVLYGLDLLREANVGQPPRLEGHVSVVGSGDAAFDSARTAVRLGAQSVTVLYRRSEQEMPAGLQERLDAVDEGIEIRCLTSPVEVQRGVIRCVRNRLGAPDSSGRRRPESVEGSEFELPADHVIVAIGQQVDVHAKPEIADVLDRLQRGMGAPEWLFAAGDALTGSESLIDAMAGGHTAAAAIHAFLSGGSISFIGIPPGRVDKSTLYDDETVLTRRQRRRMRPVRERIGDFGEVSLGYSEAQARAEARRCLACARCAACGWCGTICIYDAVEVTNGQPVFTERCDGCGLCAHLCANGAIAMVPR